MKRPLAGSALLLLSFAAALNAQDRHGFWIAPGMGGGLVRVSCDSCRTRSWRGLDFAIALGITPNPHVRVGVEWRYSARYVSDTVPLLQAYNAVASYYPRRHGGPFVECGLGLARYSTSSQTIINLGQGFGTSIGAGWEIDAGQHVLLKPQLSYSYGGVGTLRARGAPVASGWKQQLLLFEIMGSPR